MDELLLCAVIEERSSERMGLLAAATAEPDLELSTLYRELVAAEQRHGQLYLDLALELFPEQVVAARWGEVTTHEAEALRDLPRVPRLHSS
jgi:tRNA-(ms[2]io[6]A)-hydroxylase